MPLFGSTRSDGLTLSIASCHGLLLTETALKSSILLSLPFLLSFRRSRIPLALEFRTAGLRKSCVVAESWRLCRDCAFLRPTFAVIESVSRLVIASMLHGTLSVSMCKFRQTLGGLSCCNASSSTQFAGVGGTGPRLVPTPGGRLVLGAGTGAVKLLPDVDPSDDRHILWDRAFGGSPGGGGGSGMPGSQPSRDGDLLSGLDEDPFIPIPPVEAALREAGGRTMKSSYGAG